MSLLLQKIIRSFLPAELGRNRDSLSRYRVAKAYYLFWVSFRQSFFDGTLIATGVVIAGLGLKSFLLPNHFIDGGVTGISLLVSQTTGIPLSLLIVLINIPFILVAYHQISRTFAFKSILAVAGVALVIVLIPYPLITTDKLLIATFGGFFLGVGIGMAIRGGAVLDGTEVLAIYLSRKSTFSVGDIILIFNFLIFSVAAYLLGFEIAMYAVLTYLSASKTVDFIIEGVEEYVGVTIISTHHDQIRKFIVEELQVGVTAYTGSSGHGKRGRNYTTEILFTVITRLEIGRLQNAVEKIDDGAFIVIGNVRGIKGGSTRQRAVDKH